MRIPKPIYERMPHFWLLLGILFMSSGTFLGFDFGLSFVYFGVGFLCCMWSMRIFTMRLRDRKAPQQTQHQAEPAEQPQQAEQHSSNDPHQGVETGA